METTKKTRSRSKSNSISTENVQTTNIEEKTVEETTTNLNGDNSELKDADNVESKNPEKKDSEIEPVIEDTLKESVMMDDKDEKQQPKQPEPVTKGKAAKTRKRKASEMKSVDDVDESTKEKKSSSEAVDETIEPENETLETSDVSEPKEKVSEIPEPTGQNESEFKSDMSKVFTNDDVMSESDISQLTPKQTLGKGKRARVPNKRYSDILISPPNKSKVENGSDLEPAVTPISEDLAVVTEKITIKPNAPGTTVAYKKTKAPTDITNPNFLKPFQFGWKRELVWRATFDIQSPKRSGDVYYYTPQGKKVRSMREVMESLKTKELTIEDFTFAKEPLGLDDPEKEIIRDAKFKGGLSLAKKIVAKKAATAAKAHSPKVSSPKVASPKITSPKVNTPKSTPVETTESPPPKNSRANAKLSGNFKIKLPAKKAEKRKSEEEPEPEATPAKSSPATAPNTRRSNKWTNFNSEKPCQPCSIRCPGVQVFIPTLQCRHCLCLYHHECVGVSPHLAMSYVCKNCQLEQGQIASPSAAPTPPPLIPINALKPTPPVNLPKLQRIPRAEDDGIDIPYLPPPRLDSLPSLPLEHKSLVGSVTTWLPHNSKIVDTIQRTSDEPLDSIRPQYLEILAGRKFLVIPKHNFMTVSPTVAATANRNESAGTPVSSIPGIEEPVKIPIDSASLGPIINDIKVEPQSPSKPENAQTPEAMEIDLIPQETTIGQDIENGEKTSQLIAELTKDTISEPVPDVTPKTKKRLTKVNNSVVVSEKTTENKFMDHYLQNLSYGYNTLLYVFQYLKVQDLLRAGCVCTMWRDMASHALLWRTVRMKNSQVHSFDGLANSLRKHGTIHLDLRKMLLPSGGDEIWPQFSKAIERVDTLRKIELCRCPAAVVEQLAVSNPHLEVINAVTIKCESMSLEPFASLKTIKELRLKSTSGLTLTSNIDSLKELTTLKHLSLTSIRDLHMMNLGVIAELISLESLDLGECSDFPKNFGEDILVKLDNLEKLRLEKGQGNCHTFEILDAVKNMKRLEQLELVNFDIKAGFDKALGACFNIKKLLIIPTYISQSATTNHMVLGGVLRLYKTLSHFVWGVTLELLRVTELFVDQCEEPLVKDKKEKKPSGNGDSIPVLKPVPLITEKENEIPPAFEPPQVEILPLPNLQKLLLQSLPTTRVKILKIPFHATWRQSITDSVN